MKNFIITSLFILCAVFTNCRAQDSLINILKEYQPEEQSHTENLDSASEEGIYAPDTSVVLNKFDRAAWKKVIKGLDYTEKPEEEKKTVHEKTSTKNNVSFKIPYAKYIAIGTLSLVVAYLLYLVIINIMKNRNVGTTGPEINITDIEDIEDVNDDSLLKLYKETLVKGDYKSAVRILYLLLIKNYHISGLIEWKKEKTNHAYYLELKEQSFQNNFMQVTQLYEKVWFGNIENISNEEFIMIKQKFGSCNLFTYISIE